MHRCGGVLSQLLMGTCFLLLNEGIVVNKHMQCTCPSILTTALWHVKLPCVAVCSSGYCCADALSGQIDLDFYPLSSHAHLPSLPSWHCSTVVRLQMPSLSALARLHVCSVSNLQAWLQGLSPDSCHTMCLAGNVIDLNIMQVLCYSRCFHDDAVHLLWCTAEAAGENSAAAGSQAASA